MIWNEKLETMPADEMKKHQSALLSVLVKKLYGKVPFYKKKLNAAGIKPEDIKSVDDISCLPFTTKADMRDVYPYGMLAVNKEDILEIHTSSGTTGKPVVDAYTAKDIDIWSEVMARAFVTAGAAKKDTIQNAYGYGLFTGGLGAHYGARRLGANVVPISGGNTKRQLQILQDFQSDVLTCTPSYCLYLAEVGREQGIDFSKLSLRLIIPGAESWSESLRDEIESKLGVMALDIYGLTEIIGPGVAQECPQKNGLHIAEDHFFPEIIDPDTGEVLPDGEKGELVLTTLTKEGTPLLRYRTRDITCLEKGKCACGRTTVRMKRIMGRTDDMLIIRGVNVFPSQIEEVLFKFEGVEPHYQILVDRLRQLDRIEVRVEMTPRLFSDEIKNLKKLESLIEAELYGALNIHSKVRLVEPKSIPRSEGKAKRIVDTRDI
ncbi:MAG: phenylacetate--CoA ligase [Elusimicrobiota bacterium]|nr:phenylacetate--CoA ligase [Elusimicrobiota bacterium]